MRVIPQYASNGLNPLSWYPEVFKNFAVHDFVKNSLTGNCSEKLITDNR